MQMSTVARTEDNSPPNNEPVEVNPAQTLSFNVVPGNRVEVKDHVISNDFIGNRHDFKFKVFIRLNCYANTRVAGVVFDHCVFDNCYFHKSVFDTCSFNGCKFIGCNFRGTTFPGSSFKYATFERTIVDNDILKQAPTEENLKMAFARSLKVNYQQIGDAESVNKAVALELEATEAHLLKGWFSDEEYYRKKYKNNDRFCQFKGWLKFKCLDYLWGNGEKPSRPVYLMLTLLVVLGIWDNLHYHNMPDSISAYANGILHSFAEIFGITLAGVEHTYPDYLKCVLVVMRLILLAFFTALLVKRLNRR